LPPQWSASLLAVDGATTDDVTDQMRRLPGEATHLVLSVGGNNALVHASMLDLPASSMAQSVGYLADVAVEFETSYRSTVEACLCLMDGGHWSLVYSAGWNGRKLSRSCTNDNSSAPAMNSTRIASIASRGLPLSAPETPTSTGPSTAANLPNML